MRCRTLLAVQLRQSPTPYVAGRVEVRVVAVPARGTPKERLRDARLRVDVAAGMAGLARMVGRDQLHARRLVAQHLFQCCPARRENDAVEPRLPPNVRTGIVHRAPRGARHRPRLEVLEDDGAASEFARDVVAPVAAPVRELSLGAREAPTRSRAAARAPALARHAALVAPASRFERSALGRGNDASRVPVRHCDLARVAVHTEDASVVGPRHRLDLVAHGREPAAPDALDDGLHRAPVRVRVASAPAKREPAELGEPQAPVLDTDVVRDGHRVRSAGLEARPPCGAFEEPLPGLGLVLEHVAHRRKRHRLKPRRGTPKFGKRLPEGEPRRARRPPGAHPRRDVELVLLVEKLVPHEPARPGDGRKAPCARRAPGEHAVHDLAMLAGHRGGDYCGTGSRLTHCRDVTAGRSPVSDVGIVASTIRYKSQVSIASTTRPNHAHVE